MITKKIDPNSNERNFLEVLEDYTVTGSAKTFCSYKKNEVIYHPHEAATHFFMVVKGRVKVYSFSENGQEVVDAILTEGEIFGESGFAKCRWRGAFAKSVSSHTIVYQLSVDALANLLSSNPALAMKMLEAVSKKLTNTERQNGILKLYSAYSKITEFLKSMAERYGKKVGYEIMFENMFTHRDIASIIGVSRQTVTTFLNELKRKNLIYFDRRKFLIRDISKL